MIRTILLSFVCSLFFLGFAQIQQEEAPVSRLMELNTIGVPVKTMPLVDEVALRREDETVDKIADIPWRYGVIQYTNIGFDSGIYTYLPNGDRIWRITIKSEGAQTLNFTFNQYYLTGNAKLFIYNQHYNNVLGAFTKENNKNYGSLTTTLIAGDEITIELYEPRETFELNKLNLERVVHGYRSLDYQKQLKGIGDSGNCNINTICSLGDSLRNQIKSVGILLNQNNYSAGFCSGALINNTCNDGEPYFLTANHCMQGANPNNIVVGFNFESTQCNTNSWAGANNTVSGTTLVANNADSDFALLKLSSAPPSNYEVYYSGWDKTGNPSTFQTGIHHPAGDVKKISRDNNPATQVTWSNAFCWEIGNWEQGITEGGSSGSPLFSDEGLIIGQLYGGDASCSNLNDGNPNNDEDNYGRFDISWDYSNDITKQLKYWLDPCGTNETTIEGYDPNTITADEDAALQYAGYISSDFCGSKVSQDLLLRNRGNFNLTSATISYGFDGNMQQYNWNGNLLAGENETINLDSIVLSNGNHTFKAFLVATNLANDTNFVNDTANLNTTINNGVSINVALTTNYYGNENTFQILDYVNNTLIDDQGPFGILESYNNSFCLPEGGYCVTLTDDGGDGLSPAFFGLDQGNYMLNVNGEELYNTDAIGSGVTTCFKYYGGVFYSDTSAIIDTTSILDINTFNNFIVYPNPSNGVINIKSTEKINAINIYNVAGIKVYAQQFNERQLSVNIKYLSKGLYLVKVHTNKGVGIEKIIIE